MSGIPAIVSIDTNVGASGDMHDADLSQVSPIFSNTVGGRARKIMSVCGKDGLLYLLDRDTHETLYQLPITTRTDVDAPPTVAGVHRSPGLSAE